MIKDEHFETLFQLSIICTEKLGFTEKPMLMNTQLWQNRCNCRELSSYFGIDGMEKNNKTIWLHRELDGVSKKVCILIDRNYVEFDVQDKN